MKHLKKPIYILGLFTIAIISFNFAQGNDVQKTSVNLGLLFETAFAQSEGGEICTESKTVWIEAYTEIIYDANGYPIGSVYHEGHYATITVIVKCPAQT